MRRPKRRGFGHTEDVTTSESHDDAPAGDDADDAPVDLEGAPPLPGVGGNPLDSIMPIILFLGLRRLFGLAWGIVGATAWALKVAVQRKRSGHPIGKFLPIITAGIIARGIVGIITDSEAVYFGIGIGVKAAIGVALICSVLIGRNLIATYAPLLVGFDDATVASPIYRRAMDRVAIAAGVAQLVSSAFDVWLYNNSSVGGYLTIRFFVNWPFTTLVLFGSFAYLGRELAKIPGFPGVNALLEMRMAQYEAAVRDRRSPSAD